MRAMFQQFKNVSRQNIPKNTFKCEFLIKTTKPYSYFRNLTNPKDTSPQNHSLNPISPFKTFRFVHSVAETTQQDKPESELVIEAFLNTLRNYRDRPTREIELGLDQCRGNVTEDLVLDVLKRNRFEWKLGYIFFNWVSKGGGVLLGSSVYNEILNILGKMRRFDELTQVLDEMPKREGLVDDETYEVLVDRYIAAHKVEEAIGVFEKRRELGLDSDLAAFQMLLDYLCKSKHVQVAETLLHSKRNEFGLDIKSMHIVLNGWCLMGNLDEVERFWKVIFESECQPDVFSYGIYIKALAKKGQLDEALKLYRGMWEQECKPNVVICSAVIGALCSNKRVPDALEVFQEMKDRGCLPDVSTYNSFIKCFCKIQNMKKVYELLDEMEEKGRELYAKWWNFLLFA